MGRQKQQKKTKKTVISNAYEDGGLKMLDIFAFLSTMKLIWIRKLLKDKNWNNFICNIYPKLKDIDKLGSEFMHAVIQRTKNYFWRDALKHLKSLTKNVSPKQCMSL
jgi:hypothetical protein